MSNLLHLEGLANETECGILLGDGVECGSDSVATCKECFHVAVRQTLYKASALGSRLAILTNEIVRMPIPSEEEE